MQYILTEDLKHEVDAISMEAFSNPLKGITSTIKDKLHILSSHMNTTITNAMPKFGRLNFDPKVFHSRTLKVKEIKHIIDTDYYALRNVTVEISAGFRGKYPEYGLFLKNKLDVYTATTRKSIERLHNYVLKAIGKPDILSAATDVDYDNIKFNKAEAEDFKVQMNKFYNHKLNAQYAPIGSLFDSNKDIESFYLVHLDAIFDSIWNANKEMVYVLEQYKNMMKSVDLLFVRIEQKPEVFNMNNVNAERLSSLFYEAAKELEMFSALLNLGTQFLSSVDDCILKLKEIKNRP